MDKYVSAYAHVRGKESVSSDGVVYSILRSNKLQDLSNVSEPRLQRLKLRMVAKSWGVQILLNAI